MSQHHFTTTNSGINVFAPDQFRAREVRMSDIMDGLSKICRYNGQVNRFYSVAEHSVLVSLYAELVGDYEAMLPGLLHDAHETYSGDIPSPHKAMVPAFARFEDGYAVVVRQALGLPDPDDDVWRRVGIYDKMILHREMSVLRDEMPTWFDADMERAVPEAVRPVGLDWQEARAMFRSRIHYLGFGLNVNL